MLQVLNWMTIILTLYPLIKSILKIISGKYSILHLGIVVTWVMQVLPLLIECFLGISNQAQTYVNMYYAMTDAKTGRIYNLMLLGVIYFMYILANHSYKKQQRDYHILKELLNVHIPVVGQLVLSVLMFLPVLAVLLAPQPSIYLKFAYFYRKTVSAESAIRLYHTSYIMYANYIAFGASMMKYLYRKKRKLFANVDIFCSIFLYSWIDGKRALLIFSLIGILAIDILKRTYANRRDKLIAKAILFACISIAFFGAYSEYTGKGTESEFLLQYTMYFSRMSSVKTAIYDWLNGHQILEYKGQTMLYNLFFFVPRSFWPSKPVMYCKYFTAYSLGRVSTDFLSWNLLVNIWTEFVSNFGIIGMLLAVILISWVARISENSDSIVVYLFGTIFVVFYLCFGFETFTTISYLAWMASLLGIKGLQLLHIGKRVNKRK